MSLILFIAVLSIGVGAAGGAMVATARFLDQWRAEYAETGFTF